MFQHIVINELKYAIFNIGGLFTQLLFFTITMSIIPLGIGVKDSVFNEMIPGYLWIAIMLSCLMALPALFERDRESGLLEQYLLLPWPPEALSLAKTLSFWLTRCLPMILIAPILCGMFQIAPEKAVLAMPCLMLGSLSIAAIGTLGAALMAGVRGGAALLLVLLLPLFIPILVFGSLAVRATLEAGLIGTSEFTLIAAFAVASVPLSAICGGGILRRAAD